MVESITATSSEAAELSWYTWAVGSGLERLAAPHIFNPTSQYFKRNVAQIFLIPRLHFAYVLFLTNNRKAAGGVGDGGERVKKVPWHKFGSNQGGRSCAKARRAFA